MGCNRFITVRNTSGSTKSSTKLCQRKRHSKAVIFSRSSYAVAVLTVFRLNVALQYTISKMLIDFTFKTNFENLELFATLDSYMRTGFLMVYLQLESSIATTASNRDSLTTRGFFCSSSMSNTTTKTLSQRQRPRLDEQH